MVCPCHPERAERVEGSPSHMRWGSLHSPSISLRVGRDDTYSARARA
jgi:hypothetical protein